MTGSFAAGTGSLSHQIGMLVVCEARLDDTAATDIESEI